MIIRQDERAIKIRDILLPLLVESCGDTGCRIEDRRLIFLFSSEEEAIFGQSAIVEFIEAHEIAGRVIEDHRTVILILKGEE